MGSCPPTTEVRSVLSSRDGRSNSRRLSRAARREAGSATVSPRRGERTPPGRAGFHRPGPERSRQISASTEAVPQKGAGSRADATGGARAGFPKCSRFRRATRPSKMVPMCFKRPPQRRHAKPHRIHHVQYAEDAVEHPRELFPSSSVRATRRLSSMQARRACFRDARVPPLSAKASTPRDIIG
jgi:hypothetical protein